MIFRVGVRYHSEFSFLEIVLMVRRANSMGYAISGFYLSQLDLLVCKCRLRTSHDFTAVVQHWEYLILVELYFFFFENYLVTWKSYSEKETERLVQAEFRSLERLPSLLHGWQGARHLGHLLLLFLGTRAGSRVSSRAPRTGTRTQRGCQLSRQWLYPLATMPAPVFLFKMCPTLEHKWSHRKWSFKSNQNWQRPAPHPIHIPLQRAQETLSARSSAGTRWGVKGRGR